MKKLIFTLCALCVSVSMWATPNSSDYWADGDRPTNASGGIYQDATSGLYFYVNSSGNAVITYINDSYDTTSSTTLDKSSWTSGYETSNLTSLVIPEYVSDGTNQYPVTMIGRLAFFKATNFQGSLTVPSYITELGSNAFEDCSNITEVTIEYSATALKDDANQLYGSSFWNCTSIATVNLNRNVTAGRETTNYFVTPFNQLTSITTLYVGEHVTSIPIYMFYKCTNLATVYCYAGSVPSLGTDVFTQIASEATLHVCKSLLSDYQNSGWATYFSTITNDLPDPGLEEGTYQDLTTGLYFEVDEETGVVSIYHDELGVYDNNNLVVYSEDEEGKATAYTLPATVQAEEGGTIYNVTRVEANAFASSSISGHLVIPAHITTLGKAAFANCTGITEVTYEYSSTALYDENDDNQANYCFGGCSITKVNLYRDYTLKGGSNTICAPFCYFTTIQEVNIGPRVKSIPHHMFSSNSAKVLATVNCYAVSPPSLGYGVFRSDSFADGGCTLNVPQGTIDSYNSGNGTYPWNSFGLTMAELDNAFAITTNNGEDSAYATFYNGDSAVEFFNAEATVYAATSVKIEDETGNVYIGSLGSVVPAATAVLVETSVAQTMLAIATTEGATAPTTNYLYGFDTATTITSPADCVYYMLTYGTDNSLGFYWGAEDGVAFESAAHKAYLAIPNEIANKTSGISIKKDADGDTTGISSVEASEGAKVSGIYTIQGVRVSNMNQPGLYIVDGKKVMKR